MLLRIILPKDHPPKFRTVRHTNGDLIQIFEIEDHFGNHQGIEGDRPEFLDVRALPDDRWDVVTVSA